MPLTRPKQPSQTVRSRSNSISTKLLSQRLMREVRLVNEHGLSNQGLLEVRTSDGFASVCGLNQGAANAICEAMGYPGGSVYAHSCSSFRGKNLCGSMGLPVAMQNLRCEGDEDHLSQCEWEAPDQSCLDHSKDSIVVCNSTSKSQDGSLRLVDENGSPASDMGRLEVLLHGDWIPVCRKGFTQGSALVACKSMGFSAAGAGPFGCQTYGRKWCGKEFPQLQLTCDGGEEGISTCRGSAGADVFCSPEDSVVLQCQGGHPKLMPEGSKPLIAQSSAGVLCPSFRRRKRQGRLFL